MDKSWVWLPRTSLEYEQGATDFVYGSAKRLGNPAKMFCPCLQCRNLCHQSVATVLDHQVMKGMDQKYKKNKCWSKHGEIRELKTSDEQTSKCEAYELFRATFFDGDDNLQPRSDTQDQNDGIEEEADKEFMKKLEDAETPLYNACPNYTKVSAIMGLYRIKVKSGMSENYFDQLLKIVHNMLPEDNVLPTSTKAMKNYLKIFGFGYEKIHACKNDCILYRKQYKDLTSCPRCKASRWEVDKHTKKEKKWIPAKVLRYFPIKDRFRRMYRSTRMAEDLRCHLSNASEDGTMRHPVDSITWSQDDAAPSGLNNLVSG